MLSVPATSKELGELNICVKRISAGLKQIQTARDIKSQSFQNTGFSILNDFKRELKIPGFEVVLTDETNHFSGLSDTGNLIIPRIFLYHPFGDNYLFELLAKRYFLKNGQPVIFGRQISEDIYLKGLAFESREKISVIMDSLNGQATNREVFTELVRFLQEDLTEEEQLIVLYNLQAQLLGRKNIGDFKNIASIADLKKVFESSNDQDYIMRAIAQINDSLGYGLLEHGKQTIKGQLLRREYLKNQLIYSDQGAYIRRAYSGFDFLPMFKNHLSTDELIKLLSRNADVLNPSLLALEDIVSQAEIMQVSNSVEFGRFMLLTASFNSIVTKERQLNEFEAGIFSKIFLNYALGKITKGQAIDQLRSILLKEPKEPDTEQSVIIERFSAKVTAVLFSLLEQYKNYFSSLYKRNPLSEQQIEKAQNERSLKASFLKRVLNSDLIRPLFSAKTWLLPAGIIGGVTFAAITGVITRYLLQPINDSLIYSSDEDILNKKQLSSPESDALAVDYLPANANFKTLCDAYFQMLSNASIDEELSRDFKLFVLDNVLNRVASHRGFHQFVKGLKDNLQDETDILSRYEKIKGESGVSLSLEEDIFLRSQLAIKKEPTRKQTAFVIFSKIALTPINIFSGIARSFRLDATARAIDSVKNRIYLRLGIKPLRKENIHYVKRNIIEPSRKNEHLNPQNETKKAQLLNFVRNIKVDGIEKLVAGIEDNYQIVFAPFYDRKWFPLLLRPQSENAPQDNYRIDLKNKIIYLSSAAPQLVNALALVKIGVYCFQHDVIPGENYNIHIASQEADKIKKEFWLAMFKDLAKNGSHYFKKEGISFITNTVHLAWLYSRFMSDNVISQRNEPGILRSVKKFRVSQMIDNFKVGIFQLFAKNSVQTTEQRAFSSDKAGNKKRDKKGAFWKVTKPFIQFFSKIALSVIIISSLFGSLIFNVNLEFLTQWLHKTMNFFSKIPYVGKIISILWESIKDGYYSAKGILELILDKVFKIDIQQLQDLIDAVKQLFEPLKEFCFNFVIPITYEFVFPLVLFTMGIMYGGIINRIKFGKIIEGGIVLALKAFARMPEMIIRSSWFLMTNGAQYLPFDIDALTNKIGRKIDKSTPKMTKFFENILLIPGRPIAKIIFPIVTVLGTLAYLILLGLLSFPPLDLQYIIHTFQSFGIPLNPLGVFMLFTFIIGLPYSVFYSIASKLFKVISLKNESGARLVVKIMIGILIVSTVVAPFVSSRIIKQNPVHSQLIHNIKDRSIIDMEDYFRNYITNRDKIIDNTSAELRSEVEIAGKEIDADELLEDTKEKLPEPLRQRTDQYVQKADSLSGNNAKQANEAAKKASASFFARFTKSRFTGHPNIDPYTGKAIDNSSAWYRDNLDAVAEGIRDRNPAFYGNPMVYASPNLWTSETTYKDETLKIIIDHLLDIIEGKVEIKQASYRELYYLQSKAFSAIQNFLFGDGNNMYLVENSQGQKAIMPTFVYKYNKESSPDENGFFPVYDRITVSIKDGLKPAHYPHLWFYAWDRFINLSQTAKEEHVRESASARILSITQLLGYNLGHLSGKTEASSSDDKTGQQEEENLGAQLPGAFVEGGYETYGGLIDPVTGKLNEGVELNKEMLRRLLEPMLMSGLKDSAPVTVQKYLSEPDLEYYSHKKDYFYLLPSTLDESTLKTLPVNNVEERDIKEAVLRAVAHREQLKKLFLLNLQMHEYMLGLEGFTSLSLTFLGNFDLIIDNFCNALLESDTVSPQDKARIIKNSIPLIKMFFRGQHYESPSFHRLAKQLNALAQSPDMSNFFTEILNSKDGKVLRMFMSYGDSSEDSRNSYKRQIYSYIRHAYVYLAYIDDWLNPRSNKYRGGLKNFDDFLNKYLEVVNIYEDLEKAGVKEEFLEEEDIWGKLKIYRKAYIKKTREALSEVPDEYRMIEVVDGEKGKEPYIRWIFDRPEEKNQPAGTTTPEQVGELIGSGYDTYGGLFDPVTGKLNEGVELNKEMLRRLLEPMLMSGLKNSEPVTVKEYLYEPDLQYFFHKKNNFYLLPYNVDVNIINTLPVNNEEEREIKKEAIRAVAQREQLKKLLLLNPKMHEYMFGLEGFTSLSLPFLGNFDLIINNFCNALLESDTVSPQDKARIIKNSLPLIKMFFRGQHDESPSFHRLAKQLNVLAQSYDMSNFFTEILNSKDGKVLRMFMYPADSNDTIEGQSYSYCRKAYNELSGINYWISRWPDKDRSEFKSFEDFFEKYFEGANLHEALERAGVKDEFLKEEDMLKKLIIYRNAYIQITRDNLSKIPEEYRMIEVVDGEKGKEPFIRWIFDRPEEEAQPAATTAPERVGELIGSGYDTYGGVFDPVTGKLQQEVAFNRNFYEKLISPMLIDVAELLPQNRDLYDKHIQPYVIVGNIELTSISKRYYKWLRYELTEKDIKFIPDGGDEAEAIHREILRVLASRKQIQQLLLVNPQMHKTLFSSQGFGNEIFEVEIEEFLIDNFCNFYLEPNQVGAEDKMRIINYAADYLQAKGYLFPRASFTSKFINNLIRLEKEPQMKRLFEEFYRTDIRKEVQKRTVEESRKKEDSGEKTPEQTGQNVDEAMTGERDVSRKEVGGIDLNPELLNVESKSQGFIPLNTDTSNPPEFKINGLYPTIINIQPINDLIFYLGKK
ncbi:MAG: hypothetical protein HQL27_07330 [Candidatus Omnitrophica bacterium]|nr:hypothetical protein [Candidatus Omnitrophota bacterium]